MTIDLCRPADKLNVVHLELTTRCNLRCVYCEKAYNGLKMTDGEDFPSELIPKLIGDLKQIGLRHLRVSGFGETTTHPDWRNICEQLLAAEFEIELVSNFAKRYSADEILTLARFNRILVSCDTTNPDLVKQIRSKVSFDRIVGNIESIQKAATSNGLPGPDFCLSIVVTDRVVFDLPETIRVFTELGFKEFFFNTFYTDRTTFNDIMVKPVWAMSEADRCRAAVAVDEAVATARRAGAFVVQTPGLLDACEAQPDTVAPVSSNSAGFTRTLSCLTLWRQSYITVTGDVQPCCILSTPVMGSLKTHSMGEILNNDAYRAFRDSHLRGEIPSPCVGCALAGPTTVDALSEQVRSIIRPLPEVIDTVSSRLADRHIVIYGAGGHSRKLFSETNIADFSIKGIVDRNPALHGRTLHGFTIQSVEAIGAMRPDVIIISSLELQDEIYSDLASWRRQGIETIKLY